MMYFYHLLVVCVLRVAFVSASYVNIGVGGCLSCGPGDPHNAELEDFLKTQKVAQRLQSIRQQLDNSLRVQRRAKNAPKLKALPQFLVDQLMDSSGNDADNERNKDTVEMKQVVLFPEEETSNCHPVYKSSVCLKFKLTDDILLANISSAKLWFSKEQFSDNDAIKQNFTIVESASTTPISNKLLDTSRIVESDGWYQMEMTDTIKSWTTEEVNAQRTLSILCSTCNHMTNARKRVSKNKTDSPFLLLNTETKKSSRSKRGVDCHPGNSNNACCREPLEVDLRQIEGYEMVYHPIKFNAYVCRGNCYIHSAVNSEKPYATLISKLKLNDEKSKLSLPASCCTPNRFSDLPIFYASSNITLQKITIPNMIVESCGCI